MLKRLTLIVAIISILILSGCTSKNVKRIEESIVKQNEQTGYIVSQFDKNTAVAKELESSVLKVLKGETAAIPVDNVNYEVRLVATVNEAHKDFKEYVNSSIQNEIDMQSYSIERNNSLTEEEKAKITSDIKENLNKSITVHYYKDLKEGAIQQTFILPSKTGNHGVLSFNWLDGKCVEVNYIVTGEGGY